MTYYLEVNHGDKRTMLGGSHIFVRIVNLGSF